MNEKIYSGTLVLTNKAFPANVSYKLKGLFYDICKEFLSEETDICSDNNLLKVKSKNAYSNYFNFRTLSVMLGCSKEKAIGILDTFIYYGLFIEERIDIYSVNKEYAYFSKPFRIVPIK